MLISHGTSARRAAESGIPHCCGVYPITRLWAGVLLGRGISCARFSGEVQAGWYRLASGELTAVSGSACWAWLVVSIIDGSFGPGMQMTSPSVFGLPAAGDDRPGFLLGHGRPEHWRPGLADWRSWHG